MSAAFAVTRVEREILEWAMDAMEDFWASDPDDDGIEHELPRLDHGKLVLPDDDDVIDDLLYRLEEQLSDMAEQECEQKRAARGAAKAGRNLAEKVRLAVGRRR